MSGAAIGYVYEFSPYKGATFSVHLAIGDVVNDAHGWELYMSVTNLAGKARVDRKTAGVALDKLEADGFLECLETGDPAKLRTLGRALKYRFLRPQGAVVFDGKVRRETAPRVDQEVRRETAPGEASGLTRCGVGPHELKVTKGEQNQEPKPSLDPADQAPTLSLVTDTQPTIDQRAKAISDGYWSWWKDGHGGEEPLVPFMGIRQIVKGCLKAGWPEAEVKRALAGCGGAISRASMQRERSRRSCSGTSNDPTKAAMNDGSHGLPENLRPEPGKSRILTTDEVRAFAIGSSDGKP